MAPRKLSDADKRDVIELYKQPGETTTTIADRYGVSNSTISRILKTSMPEDEYSALIAQKRLAAADKGSTATNETAKAAEPKATSTKERPKIRPKSAAPASTEEPAEAAVDEQPRPDAPRRRVRSRSAAADSEDTQLGLLEDAETESPSKSPPKPILKTAASSSSDDVDSDLDDDFDDDLDDDFDDDFDDEDEEGDADDGDEAEPHFSPSATVQIMPLAEAVLPRPCYLVIDRLAELITRPLSDFADLGQIPESEESAQTLPVFDNHRVARRFSRRNQRVIKVPDGQLLTKTSPYLQAKGITHLLIDGNVYALMGDD
ncbi:MAG: helix-turn-helix domain-containing protein [Leptolyngbya sp. SIO4C1]|nr:helix-turn-helix domain-containing protein [Leptolyngbya sp. SIO4C1]